MRVYDEKVVTEYGPKARRMTDVELKAACSGIAWLNAHARRRLPGGGGYHDEQLAFAREQDRRALRTK